MLSPSKDHHTVIKQEPDPSPNLMKKSNILLIPGYDDIVEHIIPINKLGQNKVFDLWRK